MSTPAQKAVKAAIEIYAKSLGVPVAEAVELYRQHESTRECVGLLVLAQADRAGLKKMAATLPPVDRFAGWKAELKAAALDCMKRAKADDTVGMGFRCFAQCVRVPQNGPRGTNAPYIYRQNLRTIVDATPELKAFVYDQD